MQWTLKQGSGEEEVLVLTLTLDLCAMESVPAFKVQTFFSLSPFRSNFDCFNIDPCILKSAGPYANITQVASESK